MGRLRFEDVVVDAGARQLWRAGQPVHLSPKAFALLSLLIEHRPNTVDKTVIRDRLWPGTYVSDTNLPALVAEIREALGDTARHPRFVRTVHGLGYAFQAEVNDGDTARPSGVEAAQPRAWLVAEGRQLPLFAGDNILGREGPGIIVLSSSTVSRRHARIVIDEAGVFLEDLESKNGTYLNDRQVTSRLPIADGDRVRTGSLLFTFRLANTAVSTQTRSATER